MNSFGGCKGTGHAPTSTCSGRPAWGDPFTLAQAEAAGVSPDQLRGKAWRRLARGWYCWAGRPDQESARLGAAADSLPWGAGFSGPTAGRLYGLEVPEPARPEVTVPDYSRVAARTDVRVRRLHLAPGDVVWRDGLPLTSPLRTCFDLAGRLPLVEAVVAIDMALHQELIELAEFRAYVADRRGVAGVIGARHALELVEPKAESPMETRLRLLLVRGGLPRPQAQVDLRDPRGAFLGRPDLFYPQARLGIEYDGENHRDRLISDNRRQNGLQGIGVELLRYTGADLRERPATVVSEVGSALRRRSAPQSVR